MNLSKHTSLILTSIFYVAAALSIGGCKSDDESFSGAAKVKNRILSVEELEKILSSNQVDKCFKNEYIRNWIEREALYQKAVDDSLVYSSEYKKLVSNAEKEIAGALALRKYYSQNPIEIFDWEIKDYYEKKSLEFKLNEKAFIIRTAEFLEFSDAVNFRKTVINENWNAAVSSVSDTLDSVFIEDGTLKFVSEIREQAVLKVLELLNENELSIILNKEPNRFVIVQLVQKLNIGDIPDFQFVKEKVKERLKVNKRKLLYKQLIENLYSKYNVEINK